MEANKKFIADLLSNDYYKNLEWTKIDGEMCAQLDHFIINMYVSNIKTPAGAPKIIHHTLVLTRKSNMQSKSINNVDYPDVQTLFKKVHEYWEYKNEDSFWEDASKDL